MVPDLCPSAFFDRCARFDWHYDYTDDGRVWRRAHAEHVAIRALAEQDETLGRIYRAWSDYSASPLDPDDNTRRTLPRPDLMTLMRQTSLNI